MLIADFRPEHSVVLIADQTGGEVPPTLAGSLIAATPTCVAVGCRSEADGSTAFVLGDVQELRLTDPPAFHGCIETPSRILSITTVHGESILEMPVSGPRTVVTVWVNDPIEPDHISVGVGVES